MVLGGQQVSDGFTMRSDFEGEIVEKDHLGESDEILVEK